MLLLLKLIRHWLSINSEWLEVILIRARLSFTYPHTSPSKFQAGLIQMFDVSLLVKYRNLHHLQSIKIKDVL